MRSRCRLTISLKACGSPAICRVSRSASDTAARAICCSAAGGVSGGEFTRRVLLPVRGEHHYVIDGATKSPMIVKETDKTEQIAPTSLRGEDLDVDHGATVFALVGGHLGEPDQHVSALLRGLGGEDLLAGGLGG